MPANKKVFLKATDISFGFNTKSLRALSNICFTLDSSGLYFLLGPSGHGKTTLLKVIDKKLLPDSGEISYSSPPMVAFAGQVEKFLFNPDKTLTKVQDFIGSKIKDPGEAIELARHWALQLNLEKHLRKNVNELSQGETFRAWLASLLCSRSQIFCLDEAFAHLDPPLLHEIFSLLKKISLENNLIFLITGHLPQFALGYAEKILYLHLGKLVQIDTPFNLFHRPKLKVVADYWGPCNYLLIQWKNDRWQSEFGEVLPNNSQLRHQKTYLVRILPEAFNLSIESKFQGKVKSSYFEGNSLLIELDYPSLARSLFLRIPYHPDHQENYLPGHPLSFTLGQKVVHVLEDLGQLDPHS